MSPVGLTRDAGWELGVRRTLPLPLAEAWRLLFSAEVLGVDLEQRAGAEATAPDGTLMRVRIFRATSHARMSWQRPGWERPSTVQFRVRPAASGTTIGIHQEHLASGELRAELLAHWTSILDRLGAAAPGG
jgi:hypothetical protein